MNWRILWIPSDPKWVNAKELLPNPFFECNYVGIEISPFENDISKFLLDEDFFPSDSYRLLLVTGPKENEKTYDLSSDEDCRLDFNFYAHVLSLGYKNKCSPKVFNIGDLIYSLLNSKSLGKPLAKFSAIRIPVPFNMNNDMSKSIIPFYPNVLDTIRVRYGNYHNFFNLYCVIKEDSFSFATVGSDWESKYFELISK